MSTEIETSLGVLDLFKVLVKLGIICMLEKKGIPLSGVKIWCKVCDYVLRRTNPRSPSWPARTTCPSQSSKHPCKKSQCQPYIPLGATSEVQHARARRRHVALGGLLVKAVDLELLGLGHLRRAVLRETADNFNGLLELGVAHVVAGRTVRATGLRYTGFALARRWSL